MTIEQAKARLLSWCMAQVGTTEGADNWNKYAAMPEIARLYGGSLQNQPWCDIFTDAAFIACFGLQIGAAMTYQPVGGGSALCRTSALYFQEGGAWSRSPQPGDVIFFYRSGAINHQGIVVRVVGGSVITVEGNSSDMVAERCYSIGDGSIAGYGRPRWELAEEIGEDEIGEDGEPEALPHDDHFPDDGKMDDAPAESYVLRLPVLRIGARGAFVAAMQGALIDCCCSCGPDGADGEFGPDTERAVIRFQRSNGLAPDGVIGAGTAAALLGGKVIDNNTGGEDNGRTDEGD